MVAANAKQIPELKEKLWFTWTKYNGNDICYLNYYYPKINDNGKNINFLIEINKSDRINLENIYYPPKFLFPEVVIVTKND